MRCLRPGGVRRRSCQALGGDTAAFCASLVDGLAHLESTLHPRDDVAGDVGAGGGAVSMRWCADAMRMVKRMQQELLAIFKKADVPVAGAVDSSYGGDDGNGGCWFEHYMQETAALLDFCNAFKSAVSRLHRYCMVVDLAAGASARGVIVPLAADNVAGDGAVIRDMMSDVMAAVSDAERLGRRIMSGGVAGAGDDDDDAGGMVVVMLVAKITMAVVSMFVLRALTSPANSLVIVDGGGGRCTLAGVPVPELQPWRESLTVISDRFPRRPSVAEHERVAMVVKSMMVNAKLEQGGEEKARNNNGKQVKDEDGEEEEDDEMVRQHVELLRTRSGELREGVEMFDCVLDEVFDEVIKGRNEMLGIFRDKAFTMG
uniref:Uncharacterized protein n=1 Tax=Leersia perrieri TaxID=77586 RepID=A0A0D9XQ27_9ORYZ